MIEGVMMRSPRFFAIACRRQNGEIVVQQESVESYLGKFQWLNKPFLRGTLALIDAMTLGMKSLMYSANVAMEDCEAASRDGKADESNQSSEKASESKSPRKSAVNDIAIGMTFVLAMALGIGIFLVIPQLTVGLLEEHIQGSVLRNLAAGIVKLLLFIGYIVAISFMKDIRTVFQYHGAEHKVINTFEANLELRKENFSKFTTIHPRCGTSFLLVVVVVSIVVFFFLGWSAAWYQRVALRLLMLPVVAGVAYEVIRFAGKYRESKILRVLLAPGLWLQRLTTREPTDEQIEVALRALQAVIEKEKEASEPKESPEQAVTK